ncbi:MAG: RNA polymerase sigma factor [Prevotella sp.]|nr:RNA polymerase sigma factor [Prevotella sp.]
MKNVSFRNDVLPLKNILFRMALRITQRREDAEDIVQETLIRIWNKRDEWDRIDSIEAYGLKICRNLSVDRTREKGFQHESIDEVQLAPAGAEVNPYEQMMQNDRLRLVRRIINALPEKQRSCIQLRDFEGKSYKEVAEILGISEDQVKINIFRGRQAIKHKYEQIEGYGL